MKPFLKCYYYSQQDTGADPKKPGGTVRCYALRNSCEKKFIIVNGDPGVEKTTTCKKLQQLLQRSVWLDGDWCWMSNPWTVT